MLGSIFLYASLLNPYYFLVFLSLFLFQLKRAKGSLLTQIFFPYKLVTSILLLSRKSLYSYCVDGGEFCIGDARDPVE